MFVLWAFTEVVQQTILLVTMNLRWRREYLATESSDRHSVLRAHIESVGGISDALFVVILLAFIAANLLALAALLSGGRRGRLPATCFGVGATLGALSLISTIDPGAAGAVMQILYPLLQPAARFVVGVWLWRVADRAPW